MYKIRRGFQRHTNCPLHEQTYHSTSRSPETYFRVFERCAGPAHRLQSLQHQFRYEGLLLLWKLWGRRKYEVNNGHYVLRDEWTHSFPSSVQRITATSTTEAEPIALERGGKFGANPLNLLQKLGWSSIRPPAIFSDSQGALHL